MSKRLLKLLGFRSWHKRGVYDKRRINSGSSVCFRVIFGSGVCDCCRGDFMVFDRDYLMEVCRDCGKIIRGLHAGLNAFVHMGDYVKVSRCRDCMMKIGEENVLDVYP